MGVLDKIKGKFGHNSHKKGKSRSRKDLSQRRSSLSGRGGSKAGASRGQRGNSPSSSRQQSRQGKSPAAPPRQSSGDSRQGKSRQKPPVSSKPSTRASQRGSNKRVNKQPTDLKVPEAPQPSEPSKWASGGRGNLRGDSNRSQAPPRQQGGSNQSSYELQDQMEEIISQNETMIDLLKRIRQSLRSRER